MIEKIKEKIYSKVEYHEQKYIELIKNARSSEKPLYRQAVEELIKEGLIKRVRMESGSILVSSKKNMYRDRINDALTNKKPLNVYDFLIFNSGCN